MENVENFVKLIKSANGEEFLDRWVKQLKENAIRKRKVKSDVIYLDQAIEEKKEELSDVA